MEKQLNIDIDLVKPIPDMRSNLAKMRFKQPVGKSEKNIFFLALWVTVLGMGFVAFRVGTHWWLKDKIQTIARQKERLLQQAAKERNDLQDLDTSKAFFDKLQAWLAEKRSYYKDLVSVFTAFSKPLPLQEIVFNDEGVTIKLNPSSTPKIANPLKDFYRTFGQKNPHIQFSEKTLNNRIILCGTRKQN